MKEDGEYDIAMVYSAKVELEQVVSVREREEIECAIVSLVKPEMAKQGCAIAQKPKCFYMEVGEQHLLFYHFDQEARSLTVLGVLERRPYLEH